MWFEKRRGENKLLERIEALETAHKGLPAIFDEAERNTSTVQRDLKKIRLEWEDVYDRITRTMARLNARIRKSEGLADPESETEPGPQGAATPHGSHATLTQMRARHGVLPR